MVSIPIRLHKAARRERIRFHHVYRHAEPEPPEPESDEVESEEARPARAEVREFPRRGPVAEAAPPAADEPVSVERVRTAPVTQNSESRVDRSQILKGFEIEKDRYVTFDPREVAALRPRTSTELSVAEFVRLEEIDPIFFETSYYAVPESGGEKPYSLLFRALTDTGYAAIGSLAMHGREHATVIRPGRHGLILHTLFHENEVRADEEYHSDSGLVNAKELELAKRFVSALAGPFDASKLKDAFEERLRELIQTRADTAVGSYERRGVPRTAPVIDIMEALRKSLEMAKKPPKKDVASVLAAAKETTPRRRRQS